MVLCGHHGWKKACQCQEGEAKETRRDETCCVAGDDTVIPYSVISTYSTVTPGPPYCADSPKLGTAESADLAPTSANARSTHARHVVTVGQTLSEHQVASSLDRSRALYAHDSGVLGAFIA